MLKVLHVSITKTSAWNSPLCTRQNTSRCLYVQLKTRAQSYTIYCSKTMLDGSDRAIDQLVQAMEFLATLVVKFSPAFHHFVGRFASVCSDDESFNL